MLSRLSAPIGAAAVILVVGACSDSTAPRGITPAQLARHIDSLAIVAAATPNGEPRRRYLGAVEALPANGASPVRILVGTHAGSQTWQGFVLRSVGGSLGIGSPDSLYTIFAYSDFAFTNLLVAQKIWVHDQGVSTNVMLIADTVLVDGGSGSMAITLGPRGVACATMSGLTYNGSYSGPPGGCVLETFTAAVTWTFPPPFATVDPNLLSLVLPTEPFSGVFLNLN